MTLRLANTRRSASIIPLKYPLAIAAAVAALGIAALVNRSLAKKAERQNPPTGNFVTVKGVRLHYVDRGLGEPVVLLHGNGSMIQDFSSSGLIEMAAEEHRVIAFDRPGFGHSARPRGTIWTPAAQAELIHGALKQIGITQAKVLGHSWGASVAVALALKYPETVDRLDFGIGILLSNATRRRRSCLDPPFRSLATSSVIPFRRSSAGSSGRLLCAKSSAQRKCQPSLRAFRRRWLFVLRKSARALPRRR